MRRVGGHPIVDLMLPRRRLCGTISCDRRRAGRTVRHHRHLHSASTAAVSAGESVTGSFAGFGPGQFHLRPTAPAAAAATLSLFTRASRRTHRPPNLLQRVEDLLAASTLKAVANGGRGYRCTSTAAPSQRSTLGSRRTSAGRMLADASAGYRPRRAGQRQRPIRHGLRCTPTSDNVLIHRLADADRTAQADHRADQRRRSVAKHRGAGAHKRRAGLRPRHAALLQQHGIASCSGATALPGVQGHDARTMRHRAWGPRVASPLPRELPVPPDRRGVAPTALAAGNTGWQRDRQQRTRRRRHSIFGTHLRARSAFPTASSTSLPAPAPAQACGAGRAHPRPQALFIYGLAGSRAPSSAPRGNNFTPCKLELGGKGAAVVLDDVDGEETARRAVPCDHDIAADRSAAMRPAGWCTRRSTTGS